VVGLTDTEATGTLVTDTGADALCPSLVAVMVAEPVEAALTRPELLTVATPGLLLVHEIDRPVSALPFASWSVATSNTVPPTTIVAELGDTVTEATGSGEGALTVTAAESRLPSLVARMKRLPGATPRTNPPPLTVATLAFVLAHVIELGGRLLDMSTLPLSCRLSPTTTATVFG
jgi:hypothetical protein